MEWVKSKFGEEAALIVGAIVTVVNAIVTVAGVGGFDDGLQWEDLIAILTPLIGAGLIRQEVYSQKTVKEMVNTAAGTTLRPAAPEGKAGRSRRG